MLTTLHGLRILDLKKEMSKKKDVITKEIEAAKKKCSDEIQV